MPARRRNTFQADPHGMRRLWQPRVRVGGDCDRAVLGHRVAEPSPFPTGTSPSALSPP